jgi:hypothetical protein
MQRRNEKQKSVLNWPKYEPLFMYTRTDVPETPLTLNSQWYLVGRYGKVFFPGRKSCRIPGLLCRNIYKCALHTYIPTPIIDCLPGHGLSWQLALEATCERLEGPGEDYIYKPGPFLSNCWRIGRNFVKISIIRNCSKSQLRLDGPQ